MQSSNSRASLYIVGERFCGNNIGISSLGYIFDCRNALCDAVLISTSSSVSSHGLGLNVGVPCVAVAHPECEDCGGVDGAVADPPSASAAVPPWPVPSGESQTGSHNRHGLGKRRA